jgi:hypothetical protein
MSGAIHPLPLYVFMTCTNNFPFNLTVIRTEIKQDRQCICGATLWRVLVIVTSVETQQNISCLLLSYTSLFAVQ